jgi:uncharacterized membrane protein
MRAELSLEIGRPPEAVWGYLTEVSNLPAWQSGVRSARREGDRIVESRHMLGRELTTTLEIIEEERPRVFELRALDSLSGCSRLRDRQQDSSCCQSSYGHVATGACMNAGTSRRTRSTSARTQQSARWSLTIPQACSAE